MTMITNESKDHYSSESDEEYGNVNMEQNCRTM